jgi:hypothetical protein
VPLLQAVSHSRLQRKLLVLGDIRDTLTPTAFGASVKESISRKFHDKAEEGRQSFDGFVDDAFCASGFSPTSSPLSCYGFGPGSERNEQSCWAPELPQISIA